MPYKGELPSKEINSYLSTVGLRGFTEGERMYTSKSFSDELLMKLRYPEQKVSIKMLDTHLTPVSEFTREKHIGDRAFILEIGGTNIYGAWVQLTGNGPEITCDVRSEIPRKIFPDPDAFFSDVMGVVGGIAGIRPIENLGIIFTFPAPIKDTAMGVDVVSPQKQTKGFFFKDIDRAPLGEQLVDYMLRSGDYRMQEMKNLVVLNDTPAALLSTPSKIGGIVGTGYNLAAMIGGRIYNIECGGASRIPQHHLAEMVDELTGNKDQLSEKQISGMYLGMQLGIAIQEMNKLGLTEFPDVNPLDMKSEVLSDVLTGEWDTVKKFLEGDIDEQAKDSLLSVASRLRDRSAEMVAIQISTIINTFPQEFPGNSVTIPIEGSIFWKMPEHRSTVTKFLEAYTGKSFEFPSIEHAGALGAAAAAIGLRG